MARGAVPEGRWRLLGEGDIPDEAGDGVDTLTGLTPVGLLAAAMDADGQAGVGKGDSAEFVGDPASFDRTGLAVSVSGHRKRDKTPTPRRRGHR